MYLSVLLVHKHFGAFYTHPNVHQHVKMFLYNLPLCFHDLFKEFITGDDWNQVLQEPVRASHADQGRKSGVYHPFPDPGGQAGSNGTPHLPLASRAWIPQGGVVVVLYI